MVSVICKKQRIVFLTMLTIGFFIFSFSNCSKEKTSRENSRKPSVTGPIIDTNIGETMSPNLTEAGAETPESLALLGDKYFENKRYYEAISIYEKALKLNPNDVDTYNDLGLALHYTGKSDLAIDTLRKGTAVNPSFQRTWLSLGFILTTTGKKEEAKEALQKAMAIDPETGPGLEAKRILGLLK